MTWVQHTRSRIVSFSSIVWIIRSVYSHFERLLLGDWLGYVVLGYVDIFISAESFRRKLASSLGLSLIHKVFLLLEETGREFAGSHGWHSGQGGFMCDRPFTLRYSVRLFLSSQALTVASTICRMVAWSTVDINLDNILIPFVLCVHTGYYDNFALITLPSTVPMWQLI